MSLARGAEAGAAQVPACPSEEGASGGVQSQRQKTDEIVALKRLKMEKERRVSPSRRLREINTILKAQHPQTCVTVRGNCKLGSNMDKIYIVMNYVAKRDLKSLMELDEAAVLARMSFDFAPRPVTVKIGWRLWAGEYGSPLRAVYTPSLWRCGTGLQSSCWEPRNIPQPSTCGPWVVYLESSYQKPLFRKSEIDQINKVFKDLELTSEKIWPGYRSCQLMKKMTFTNYRAITSIKRFLTYYPGKRINAEDGLKHEYFRETPLPIDPSMFPTWPAKSEQQRVKRGTSPRPPEGGLGYSQLGGGDPEGPRVST
uniref:Uncharacterized protein n=1 Tax=Sphaerodactylus townsendi TaxID=933632 RepID=A0ACB8EEA0_9SAUR